MFKLISGLINLNAALAQKARSEMAYDEALALRGKKDFKNAFPLMVEAAELGNEQAMALLGSTYLLGEGVKEDGVQAVKWLQKSIDAGYEGGISVLGMAYATGKAGVRIDIETARKMLTYCAEKGDEQSARMLSMMDRGEGMFKNLKKTKRSK